MSKRVLVAMSGGIDSSVVGLLLKEQGYDLIGVTFIPFRDELIPMSIANSDNVIAASKEAAKRLGIDHHVIDINDEFREYVIKDFINQYLQGYTPNPCVICNKRIKWGVLYKTAEQLGCDYIATGHYANVLNENGRYFLRKGADGNKDQTYFLWMLTQEMLSHTLFPLGQLTKDEVREIALKHGMVKLVEKKESQEICFIPNDNYRDFLSVHVPDLEVRLGAGVVLDTKGNKLGEHTGLYKYTIGQRRGLGIATGRPMYVVSLDLKNNVLVLGDKEDLYGSSFKVENVNLMKVAEIDKEKGLKVNVKIRYRSNGVGAILMPDTDGSLFVELDSPAESITPGQSAVFYDENDNLIGGGSIEK